MLGSILHDIYTTHHPLRSALFRFLLFYSAITLNPEYYYSMTRILKIHETASTTGRFDQSCTFIFITDLESSSYV